MVWWLVHSLIDQKIRGSILRWAKFFQTNQHQGSPSLEKWKPGASLGKQKQRGQVRIPTLNAVVI